MKQKIALIAAVLFGFSCQFASAQSASTPLTTQIPQLFLPFTYYGSVAHEMLSLDESPSEVSSALLAMYLRRPDLVQSTEETLREEYAAPAEEVGKPVAAAPVAEVVVPVEPETPEVDVEVKKPNFWTFKADSYLQFLQNYVSGNWYKGGESNYSMLSGLTVEANYNNKSKWRWDNKLELKLGFQTSPSDTVNKFKANEDLIRLTSKVGLQATKHWYYTLQFIGYTQFTRGLKPNDRRTYSDFTSPLNLNLALGMDYKVEWLNKKLTGTVNISPIALNYRYVDRTIFRKSDTETKWFPTLHGLDDGKHSLFDPGSSFTIDVEWKIAENISWKSRMYGFTSYKRVEYEWENMFSFQFNKYISTKLFVHPRFDDNRTRDDDYGYWMLKEFLSLGFNYSF
ncbi:MAG: DUF3078 domain-containing protein [Prevotella sp.]|nr:DUF3078 domain-containing protein [Prevotella sp.]